MNRIVLSLKITITKDFNSDIYFSDNRLLFIFTFVVNFKNQTLILSKKIIKPIITS